MPGSQPASFAAGGSIETNAVIFSNKSYTYNPVYPFWGSVINRAHLFSSEIFIKNYKFSKTFEGVIIPSP